MTDAIRHLLTSLRLDASGEERMSASEMYRLADLVDAALLALPLRETQEEKEEKAKNHARTGEPALTSTAQLPRRPTE